MNKFSLVKEFIDNGRITEIREITTWIPKTTLANKFGTNNDRMTRLIRNPEEFTIQELLIMAEFLNVKHSQTIKMACNQFYRSMEENNMHADM